METAKNPNPLCVNVFQGGGPVPSKEAVTEKWAEMIALLESSQAGASNSLGR